MTAKLAKAALFLASMVFFAVLALNIAVPALVLGALTLASEVLLSDGHDAAFRGDTA